MENKLNAILKEIKSNKSASTVTNPRSEMNDIQNMQPTGSTDNRSIGVHASYNDNSDSENEDHPLQASKMRDLRHPARPIHESETNINETMISDEDSEEEDYHLVTGANRQLHRQSSQNPLNETIGSHADRKKSTMTETPSDPVNQIAQVIEKLANKTPQQSLFHPKNTLTFNGKNEKNKKFEYFEDLFYTTLRMQPNLTEEMKINHFHAHLRSLALKTFKNIQRTPSTTLEDILKVCCRKNVKPESSASAKHSFNRLFFDPESQKLPDFLEELQESAEKAFGNNAHQMIENLLYAKMPPHLKKSINQAYLENGTYDQIVKNKKPREGDGTKRDRGRRNPWSRLKRASPKKNKTSTNQLKNKMKSPKLRPPKQYLTKHSKTTSAVIAKRRAI